MTIISPASLDQRIARTRASNKRAVEVAERRSVEMEKAAERSNERIGRALRVLKKAGYRT